MVLTKTLCKLCQTNNQMVKFQEINDFCIFFDYFFFLGTSNMIVFSICGRPSTSLQIHLQRKNISRKTTIFSIMSKYVNDNITMLTHNAMLLSHLYNTNEFALHGSFTMKSPN